MADRSTAELANRLAQHQPVRLLALMAATWLLAVPLLALVWVAVGAVRRRAAPPRPRPLPALVTSGSAWDAPGTTQNDALGGEMMPA